MNLYDKESLKQIVPKEFLIQTSNGRFKLKNTDCVSAPPQIFLIYHHYTPDKTHDVLSDGEPDYLGIDMHLINEPKKCKCDITYGDAMMFSFEIDDDGELTVGHYNGYGSKFDPNYSFYFEEESINSLISLIYKITNKQIDREKFNFLDGNKNSFQMEKVNHPRIVDFRTFNRRGPL
jgi:hypothetical protein